MPPSSDPEHPPDTRVWKGQPGTLHIEGPRCWFCPVGGELCRLFAQKQVGPDHGNVDPGTFPLDQLHRNPAPFVALAYELDRRFIAVLTPPTQLQPPTWRTVWQAVARGGVKELAHYAERPHHKNWVARLRMELDAVEAELCPGLCIDPQRDAYYVADTAHQWRHRSATDRQVRRAHFASVFSDDEGADHGGWACRCSQGCGAHRQGAEGSGATQRRHSRISNAAHLDTLSHPWGGRLGKMGANVRGIVETHLGMDGQMCGPVFRVHNVYTTALLDLSRVGIARYWRCGEDACREWCPSRQCAGRTRRTKWGIVDAAQEQEGNYWSQGGANLYEPVRPIEIIALYRSCACTGRVPLL